jgi:periplasmic divalent cation tolerance protein
MATVVLVLTTIPEALDASADLRALVEAGHAACVSVLPVMESTYRWQGAVETARERQVLIKTTADRVAGLEAAVTAWHPYDVPEWLVVSVAGGGDAYLRWIATGA